MTKELMISWLETYNYPTLAIWVKNDCFTHLKKYSDYQKKHLD
jgi:hypothetical protein